MEYFEQLDTRVKLSIYNTLAETARMPSSRDLARFLNVSPAEVEASFDRLHKKRLLVPEPGDPSRIRMAPPFSGIATPFKVLIEDKTFYANCVWDAYGIAAALHKDAVVKTSDAHTDESLTLEVENSRPVNKPYVVHFAVPAAKWWENIIYT
jgi:DNA-binding transcriptional MocR family regulator